MIKSDAQLQRTKEQIEGFRQAIQTTKETSGLTGEILASVVASQEGMIAKLEYEVNQYEDLKRGHIELPRINSVTELAQHLVKFRIALGVTQEALAEMIGVTRQTINKHEEQEYQTATVALITEVANALRILPDIRVKHQTLHVEQPAAA